MAVSLLSLCFDSLRCQLLANKHSCTLTPLAPGKEAVGPKLSNTPAPCVTKAGTDFGSQLEKVGEFVLKRYHYFLFFFRLLFSGCWFFSPFLCLCFQVVDFSVFLSVVLCLCFQVVDFSLCVSVCHSLSLSVSLSAFLWLCPSLHPDITIMVDWAVKKIILCLTLCACPCVSLPWCNCHGWLGSKNQFFLFLTLSVSSPHPCPISPCFGNAIILR